MKKLFRAMLSELQQGRNVVAVQHHRLFRVDPPGDGC